MEGRDFAAPAHLLSERGALAHRAAAAAARISSAGHGSVQHAGHFPAGKYYPSHIQMAAHSGRGLVGNSSSSFMGSFLAGGLGSPAPHPPHPPRAPSSPSSPSFRGAPHSSASQIWFPHSHEATGYPRFSGSLTHTFLPMGPLDHHANSGVLYGQHRFYDTQKENFYLRGLTSQPIIPTKHSMPPISRAGPEGGANLKGLREGGPERMVPPSRQKEPISNKQEAKDRKQHPTHQLQQTQAPPPASNQHHREEHSGHSVAAPPPQAITTPLSACLLNSKSPSNHCGSQGGAKSFSCGEGGGVRCRERVRGEMRISEQPGECVPRDQAIQHTLTYPLPHSLPATGTAHTRSFHCLQFHPHNHYNHGHPDLLYHHSTGHLPNPPTPEHGPGATTRDPKATAPPFGQTVVHHGNKSNVKQMPCRKAEKGPDWSLSQQPAHLPQQQHRPLQASPARSRSADPDPSRAHQASQQAKACHSQQFYVGPQPYRDCSLSGPLPNLSPLPGKPLAQDVRVGGVSCSLQRDGQKVARIRHQQHGRPGTETPGAEATQASGGHDPKRKLELTHNPNHNHNHKTGRQHQGYMESFAAAAAGASHQAQPPMAPSPADNSAIQGHLKYNSQQQQQQQPLHLQKSPFGGLGSLKASCSLQGSKPALAPRRGSTNDSQRPDCGGRTRDAGEVVHNDGEVRQPPVGIAVAVARQRDPPCCLTDSQGRGRSQSTIKGTTAEYGCISFLFILLSASLDPSVEDDRRRLSSHICLLRDNKERLEFARIHPSNSCHGDFSSHLMGSAGPAALQEPSAHAHSAHHHWMAQTGNPSLWMSGHSYSLGHSALHQTLPPGFPTAVPPPLQPVLPLPQDPPALVMLPSEPPAHPPSHLDVMDSSALWPPVFRHQGPAHIQHPAVFSRQQLLRQQELYALQQQQQHQQKPEEGTVELEDILSDTQSPPASAPYYSQPNAASAHITPCCQSPCLRPHPQSTPSTPCPAPSPTPSQPTKTAEPQGQPPQDYPQSLEPAKAGMEAVDGQELAIRLRLAELQQRYREKQRELAKLQRKDENQKEEAPRSPVRRGPGRPRKRRTPTSPAAPADAPRKLLLIQMFVMFPEEEEDDSYDSEDEKDLKAPPSRDFPSASAVAEPTPSSVVKLEAYQKAQNKRERQHYGKMQLEQGDTVSRLLKFGLASDEDLGEESSFSEEEDQVLPNCVLTKDHLADGLKILISKEDELLYAARVHKLQVPDLYSVLIEGERGAQPRIYVQEQLLHGAVLDVCPEKEGSLKEGTRVCAYWSERSHCLYPGYELLCDSVGVFDDGDRGRISLHNIRLLPPGYQIKCESHIAALHINAVISYKFCTKKEEINHMSVPSFLGRPKGSGVKNVFRSAAGTPSWSPVAPKRRAPENLFQLSQQKNPKLPHLSISAPMATKSIFSSHFEVDSFSSIAKSYGYSSFCGQGVALGGCSDPFGARKRSQEVAGTHRSRKSEFLVKLDHEGVMAPKTKNAKALQEQRGVVGVTRSEAYSHPVLLVKDNRKDGHTGPELLLEVAPPRRKPTPPVGPSDCGSVWGSFGSNPNMDEKRSEEARTAGCFMSRPSGSSCSSSSCSSSSSGSLSSSSPCSSDNDSSWSSEEEESSPTLLLQSCPPSQRPPLLAAPGHLQHAFVAKAVAVSNKLQKRKERPTSSSSPPRHRNKKHKVLENECHSHFLQAKKLWRWAGIPTQRRGMKGRARKLFYKAVVCGRETVLVGDCAVFLSTRRTRLPCIGHILGFWESWSGNMMVKVKWFYHPDEIGPGSRKWEDKHGLYQSCHEDETDVQTISHKCRVFSREEYESARHSRKSSGGLQDVYYLAGTYDPSRGQLVEAESLSGLC
uniref:BAH domain-containing protein n=1 Tax=Denticeps clupeoides TaxID=299321 RepID=A0AAY4ARJ8_9TELE